jgi:hypothetical protein
MSDPVDRLRELDPAASLPEAQAPPPADVLARIVASRPDVRKRRAPRLVMAAAALAVAAVAVVAALEPPGSTASFAERAYAATAPTDAVTYTQSTLTETRDGVVTSTTHTRLWQYADRMHDVMDIVQHGKAWRYEHDQKDGVFRTLYNGRVDSIGVDDPGWRGGEGREGFAQNVRTAVDEFRARYPRLRDAGDTTFNGRPARAYTGGQTTYYIDRETSLPLGNVLTGYGSEYDPKRHGYRVSPDAPLWKWTETIDHYERLPATAANLAQLDAPAIDAAESRGHGK